MRSAGPCPPDSTGTRTASGPSKPCTRTSARRARSLSCSPSPPHSGNCKPSDADTVSTACSRSRVTAAVGRSRAFRLFNHPSSCQRTRSAVASSVSGSAHRHTRLRSSPLAVTA
ncbi:Uncharacterised protein [Mycobacterium tuberculosis]|uniref:Uncharacterized protein n=1 Tax=Mycobacterium tuberculosis TaxID=1773 RepID=A0A916P7R7_MYCTX|nr:Uncharacterised protein [Mycobacterium tuberculosis]